MLFIEDPTALEAIRETGNLSRPIEFPHSIERVVAIGRSRPVSADDDGQLWVDHSPSRQAAIGQ